MIKKHLNRLYKAFLNSLAGLHCTFKNEIAFRQEVYLLPIIIVLACILASNRYEWLILILSYLFILIAELINTAIENSIDRISLERHKLSKNAKDIGSAIVLLTIVLCVIVWLVILIHS